MILPSRRINTKSLFSSFPLVLTFCTFLSMRKKFLQVFECAYFPVQNNLPGTQKIAYESQHLIKGAADRLLPYRI